MNSDTRSLRTASLFAGLGLALNSGSLDSHSAINEREQHD
jgi:hypothetical protein